jgi:hypothetical protein
MSRNTITAGLGILAAAAAAAMMGLGTAPAALADDSPSADQIQALLSGDGVTSADFKGDATLANAATALANGTNTDVFNDDVTAAEVTAALHAADPAIHYSSTSDVTSADIAGFLNDASSGGFNPPFGTGSGGVGDPFIDPYLPPNGEMPNGYTDLFGGMGTQGVENQGLNEQLIIQDPTTAASFSHSVELFEEANSHPLENLIYALDPSAFYLQVDAGVDGTIASTTATIGGETLNAHLVPDDILGYTATLLDYGLLTPTGLGFILDPVINILAGEPPAAIF